MSRYAASGGATARGLLFKRSNLGTRYDYMDNEFRPSYQFDPQWDVAEEPSVDKEF